MINQFDLCQRMREGEEGIIRGIIRRKGENDNMNFFKWRRICKLREKRKLNK